jgi:hypoxanthine phosphoribosyltransferase
MTKKKLSQKERLDRRSAKIKNAITTFRPNRFFGERAREISGHVAKTAEKIIKQNPSALVAVDKKGVIATRLVQHYMKKRLGTNYKKLPVYIINKGRDYKSKEPIMVNKHMLENLKKENKVAIVEDVRVTGDAINAVKKFLFENTSLKKDQIQEFPLSRSIHGGGPLWIFETEEAISPTHKVLDKNLAKSEISKRRRSRAVFLHLFKRELDFYMKQNRLNFKEQK